MGKWQQPRHDPYFGILDIDKTVRFSRIHSWTDLWRDANDSCNQRAYPHPRVGWLRSGRAGYLLLGTKHSQGLVQLDLKATLKTRLVESRRGVLPTKRKLLAAQVIFCTPQTDITNDDEGNESSNVSQGVPQQMPQYHH